ncbi:unnamed protein product [Protopolystoma xenopodis]|uniref:Uncharacterized protein n=1 Tax=Protopolystoma xenopodis TaxID=117903 RepID=A0A3S5AJL2_9PLAT|nr:unnamed protein product [Protopolystoma xenopodis]
MAADAQSPLPSDLFPISTPTVGSFLSPGVPVRHPATSSLYLPAPIPDCPSDNTVCLLSKPHYFSSRLYSTGPTIPSSSRQTCLPIFPPTFVTQAKYSTIPVVAVISDRVFLPSPSKDRKSPFFRGSFHASSHHE